MKKHVLNNYKLKYKEDTTAVEGTRITETVETVDEDNFEHYIAEKEI